MFAVGSDGGSAHASIRCYWQIEGQAAAHVGRVDGFRFINFNGLVDPALFTLVEFTTAPFIAILVNY